MNPHFTPLHISLLIHYHCSPVPYAEHDSPHRFSLAVAGFRADLFRWGLITPVAVMPGGQISGDVARLAAIKANPRGAADDHDIYTTTAFGRTLLGIMRRVGAATVAEFVAEAPLHVH